MFGNIANPFFTLAPGVSQYQDTHGGGIITLITALYRLAIIGAGIYTLLNITLAGFGYLSANGDPKMVTKAHDRIWRSFLGLAVIVGALLVAVIVGYLLYGPDGWDLLINPRIYNVI